MKDKRMYLLTQEEKQERKVAKLILSNKTILVYRVLNFTDLKRFKNGIIAETVETALDILGRLKDADGARIQRELGRYKACFKGNQVNKQGLYHR